MKKILTTTSILIFIASAVYADMQSAIDALNSKNYKQAFNEFMVEAKGGNADAMNYLGILYASGLGCKQDYDKAVIWYEKAVNKNNAAAMNNLANLYVEGKGVKQDYQEAILLFNKAIARGYYPPFYNLAIMYFNGLGVEKDCHKSINLLNKAAEHNVGKAQAILATICYTGALEQNVDYLKAKDFMLKAADDGISSAQMGLGTFYMEGKAVKQDYQKAYMWYYIAYKNGVVKAL